MSAASIPVSEVIEILRCPAVLTPCANATLLPCMHKISSAAADRLYNKPLPPGQVARCILCRQTLAAIKINKILQSLIDYLFSPFNHDPNPVIRSLTCPEDAKPLTEAIYLIPCGDRVNQSAFEKFNQATEGKYPDLCPACCREVKVFGKDETTRQLAKIFFAGDPAVNLEACRTDPAVVEAGRESNQMVNEEQLAALFRATSRLDFNPGEHILFYPEKTTHFRLLHYLLLNGETSSLSAISVFDAALRIDNRFITGIPSPGVITVGTNSAFVSLSFPRGGSIETQPVTITLSLKLLGEKMIRENVDVISILPEQFLFLNDFGPVILNELLNDPNPDLIDSWLNSLLTDHSFYIEAKGRLSFSPGKPVSLAIKGDKGFTITLKKNGTEGKKDPVTKKLVDWPAHELKEKDVWLFNEKELARYFVKNSIMTLPPGITLKVCAKRDDTTTLQALVNRELHPIGLRLSRMDCPGSAQLIFENDFYTLSADAPFELEAAAMHVICPSSEFVKRLIEYKLKGVTFEPNQMLFLRDVEPEAYEEFFQTNDKLREKLSKLLQIPNNYNLTLTSKDLRINKNDEMRAIVLSGPHGFDFDIVPISGN